MFIKQAIVRLEQTILELFGALGETVLPPHLLLCFGYKRCHLASTERA